MSAEPASCDGASPGSVRGVAPSRRIWLVGLCLVLAFGAIGVFSVSHWMAQAQREREALHGLVESLGTTSRAQLQAEWGDKVRWIPSDAAAAALAVLPRRVDKDFDAIYVLFSDAHVSATLTLTPVAGYFNGQALDIRRNPQTLLAQRLTAQELRSLRAMIVLLQGDLDATRRDRPLDTQGSRFTWTEQVVRTAQALLAAQSH